MNIKDIGRLGSVSPIEGSHGDVGTPRKSDAGAAVDRSPTSWCSRPSPSAVLRFAQTSSGSSRAMSAG
jgi:hypothetical protein